MTMIDRWINMLENMAVCVDGYNTWDRLNTLVERLSPF